MLRNYYTPPLHVLTNAAGNRSMRDSDGLAFAVLDLAITTTKWIVQKRGFHFEPLGLRVSEMPKTMNYLGLGKEAFPPRIATEEFMDSVRVRLPKEYLLLSAYLIQFEGYSSYYLLKISDTDTRKMIMYDYSCSDPFDGPVYQDEKKYSFENRVVPIESRGH